MYRHGDCAVYEGCLLAAAMATHKKVKAGLQYAGSGQHQAYPPGVIELGVALDALDMVLADLVAFVKNNAADQKVASAEHRSTCIGCDYLAYMEGKYTGKRAWLCRRCGRSKR